ncbi:glutamate-1-semialdehyde 2,1-aminomutase [Amedibacillus sp. YH-ame10]
MNNEKSKELFEEACKYIPGGVNSPVRSFANVGTPPIFVERASGSHVNDVDGNSYIDYIGSWGPMILGHAHPIVTSHVDDVVKKGISYGLCTAKEIELAKLICDAYAGVDMVRMVNSGTEATMSAIRVARGYSGKENIIKFEGCYHGHSDGLLVQSGSGALTFGIPTSPGVLHDVVKHTLVARYNDINSVKELITNNKGNIAAIILEPVAGNMGVIPAIKEFLFALRALCDEEQIVLIFDEVITGFRLRYGGASEYYGIVPDMVCFGKIIGAGMPVGAYGGRADIMKMVSPQGPIYQAGTLSGNPFAMELGVRLLTYLKQHPTCYQELEEKGKYMKEQLQRMIEEYQLPCVVHQVGSLCSLFFRDELPYNYQDVSSCHTKAYTIFFQSLLQQGILIAPSPYEAMFLSTAHTQDDIDTTLNAMKHALKQVKEHVFSCRD